MSSSQTLRLVSLLGKYINESPTLGPKSRHLESLLQVVIDKLKSAVDNDVFIPINLKMLVLHYDCFQSCLSSLISLVKSYHLPWLFVV